MKRASISVTAQQVADLVGVSVSTVGRALAGDARISVETRTRVKNAAERCGYLGNVPARIMRGGASNLVGLILPDVRNDFYASMAQALTEACGIQGHQIVLSITGDDAVAEARSVRELASGRVAGVIVVPSPQPTRETFDILRRMPCVQLLRHVPELGGAWFGIDDEASLFDATTHLLRLGHERIAYVGGRELLSTGAARLRGFRMARREGGIGVDRGSEFLGSTTAEFGEHVVRRLARSTKPFTAVVAGSVHITLGIIAAIEKGGIRVPQDLSVVGFGDPEWFAWWRGGLTTTRPPTRDLALSCGQWFMRRLISGEGNEEVSYSAVAKSRLVIRATVAERSPGRGTGHPGGLDRGQTRAESL